ncbi:hypothetical protein AaE_004791, partial [Aphanomyces astaci]
INKVIKDLTAANLVPKDALAGGSTSAPITTSVTPATSKSPMTSIKPVTTKAPKPATTKAPKPATTKAPVAPTTSAPVGGDCTECKGCYTKLLGACFPNGFTEAQCVSFTVFQTTWCGN